MKDLLQQLKKFPSTVELHITVDLSESSVDEFKSVCEAQGVKPLLIKLVEGQYQDQPMISKFITGSPEEIYKEVILTRTRLALWFPVLRVKVEVKYDGKGVPRTYEDVKSNNWQQEYFEFHMELNTHAWPGDEGLVQLNKRLAPGGVSLSTNVNGKVLCAQRVRSTPLSAAMLELKSLQDRLRTLRVPWKDCVKEFNIYDSNTSIDKGCYGDKTCA